MKTLLRIIITTLVVAALGFAEWRMRYFFNYEFIKLNPDPTANESGIMFGLWGAVIILIFTIAVTLLKKIWRSKQPC